MGCGGLDNLIPMEFNFSSINLAINKNPSFYSFAVGRVQH
jgi:hypothetical protein